MTTPDKPDHARGWRYVEKLLDEEEDERIKGLSDDQVRAELRQRPAQPAGEWSADEMLARAAAIAAKAAPTPAGETAKVPLDAPANPVVAPPAPKERGVVVPMRRRWGTFGLLAAACFVLFMIVKANQGPDIVSHPPTKQALAEAARDQAEASCALKDWVACKASLDEAAKLDPAGESEPRVQKAREAIVAGMGAHPGGTGR